MVDDFKHDGFEIADIQYATNFVGIKAVKRKGIQQKLTFLTNALQQPYFSTFRKNNKV